MPTTNDLSGFILKKEACRDYDRSLRQLGRDFDKASANGDSPFISNFKLRIEDGTVLEAAEVDKDKVQALRDKGLNPTWFVRESWMRDNYGVRREGSNDETFTPTAAPQSPEPPKSERAEPQSADTSNPDIVQAKDDLIEVLREETKYLREMLAKERERSSDDKQLTRELHVLLKNMQDRLLPAPSSEQHILQTVSPSQTPQSPAAAAQVVERPKVQSPAKPKPPVNTSPPKKATKKRAASKRKAPTKKKAPSRQKSPPKNTLPVKPKWYEMPSFKRFFSSSK